MAGQSIYVQFAEGSAGDHIRKWSLEPFDGSVEYAPAAPDGDVAELVGKLAALEDWATVAGGDYFWLSAELRDLITSTLTSQQAELDALRIQRDNAIQQAQGWKMEANAHKSSLHEAYQHVTGSTGEPGNWNGANPIIEALQKQGEA